MSLEGFQRGVAEAWALQHWQTGQAPPVEALNAAQLRRRIAIQQMESRVVRQAVAEAKVDVSPKAVDALLADALAGRKPGSLDGDLSRGDALPPDVDTRLSARFGVDAERIRSVAADLVYAHAFTAHLLKETPEDALQKQWREAETRVTLELVKVPRVPTTDEITAAVSSRASELQGWYDGHPRLFKTPERRRVRVVMCPEGQSGQEAANALRSKVIGGETLEAAAKAWGGHPSAEQGGVLKTVSKKRMPEAFAVPVGQLSEVVKHPQGWMLFFVEAEYPGSVRPITDGRVQREIAAAILREADDLPSAQRMIQRVKQRLSENASLQMLERLKTMGRLRFEQPKPFAPTTGDRVPGLGLAPEVAAAMKSAQKGAVLGPFTVRQDYVVLRIVDRVEPEATLWAQAKADFIAQWRRRKAPRMIDEWLDKTLKGQKLFVNQEVIDKLSLDAVTQGLNLPPQVNSTPQ